MSDDEVGRRISRRKRWGANKMKTKHKLTIAAIFAALTLTAKATQPACFFEVMQTGFTGAAGIDGPTEGYPLYDGVWRPCDDDWNVTVGFAGNHCATADDTARVRIRCWVWVTTGQGGDGAYQLASEHSYSVSIGANSSQFRTVCTCTPQYPSESGAILVRHSDVWCE